MLGFSRMMLKKDIQYVLRTGVGECVMLIKYFVPLPKSKN
jgi:hypothetical protein